MSNVHVTFHMIKDGALFDHHITMSKDLYKNLIDQWCGVTGSNICIAISGEKTAIAVETQNIVYVSYEEVE